MEMDRESNSKKGTGEQDFEVLEFVLPRFDSFYPDLKF